MHQTTLDKRGRTTVPVQIRHTMKALAGGTLVWQLTPDGTLMVHRKEAAPPACAQKAA